MQQLVNVAPHLKGGFNPKRALRLFLWIGGGLIILAGLIIYAQFRAAKNGNFVARSLEQARGRTNGGFVRG